MNERKYKILEKARQLFSEQGFKGTSMQKIADACQISKGAVYLDFPSKDALIKEMMIQISDGIVVDAEQIRSRKDLSPREKLATQVKRQFEDVAENQGLMESYLTESGLALDEDMIAVLQKYRFVWQKMQEDFLYDIYGDRVVKHLHDLSVIFNAVLNEYFTILILDEVDLDVPAVASYLIELMDHQVAGLTEKNAEPLLRADQIPGRSSFEDRQKDQVARRMETALKEINAFLADSQGPAGERDDALDSLKLLESELAKKEPSRVMVQGMLANLGVFPELSKQRQLIADGVSVRCF